MDFEDLQKSWQNQDAAPKIAIDASLLLKEVRRNQNQLLSTLFWRDFREVGVAAVMAFMFTKSGLRLHDWTHFLMAAACVGVGAFMLMDRYAQRRKVPSNQDSLKACLEASLAQVSHQIWLLKNVAWWYLLPLSAAMLISMVWGDLHQGLTGGKLAAAFGYHVIFCGLLNGVVYWLNQHAVRKTLEPRRQELQEILTSLES